jgi:hypothetical protein
MMEKSMKIEQSTHYPGAPGIPWDDGYRKNRVVAALIAASTQFLEDPNQC